jgi:hypothetical protein
MPVRLDFSPEIIAIIANTVLIEGDAWIGSIHNTA